MTDEDDENGVLEEGWGEEEEGKRWTRRGRHDVRREGFIRRGLGRRGGGEEEDEKRKTWLTWRF